MTEGEEKFVYKKSDERGVPIDLEKSKADPDREKNIDKPKPKDLISLNDNEKTFLREGKRLAIDANDRDKRDSQARREGELIPKEGKPNITKDIQVPRK